MISSDNFDEEHDSMDDFLFECDDDNENPVDTLNKLKNLIEKLDADAERVQQEITKAIQNYEDVSDDDSAGTVTDIVGETTRFLGAMPGKENQPKVMPRLALHLNTRAHSETMDSLVTPTFWNKTPTNSGATPSFGFKTPSNSSATPSFGFKTPSNSSATPCFGFKTPSNTRTPMASRNQSEDPHQKFSFNDECCSSLVTTPEAELQTDLLSPCIKIESPVKKNDPYQWAYAVWRAHGLMGRNGETPIQKVDPTTMDTTPISSFGMTDTSEWDLSPLNNVSQTQRKSSATKGADRAKEFARESTGNFHNVLSTWRTGRLDDTPSRAEERDFARMRKPEKFKDLLRKWREARQEQAVSGKQRAMSYAYEAKTNIQSIIKIWHDSQSAEFELWAKEHARSPDELAELLANWEGPRFDKGQEDNVNFKSESNTNMTEVMKHWRESHAFEFEEWAREQSHSSEEFKELLRQWREASPDYASSTREVQKVLRQWRVASPDYQPSRVMAPTEESTHHVKKNLRKRQESCESNDRHEESPRNSSLMVLQQNVVNVHDEGTRTANDASDTVARVEKFDDLLSKWRLAEACEFNQWARRQASSQEEFQALLRKWNNGNCNKTPRDNRDISPAAPRNFRTALAMWQQSDMYQFEDWAQQNSNSPTEFRDLMTQWRARSDEPSERIERGKVETDIDMCVSQWRATESGRFCKWARQNASSKEDFHKLLHQWQENANAPASGQRNDEAELLSCTFDGNVTRIMTLWQDSEMYSFEDWAQKHAGSLATFPDLIDMWRQFCQKESETESNCVEHSDEKADRIASSFQACAESDVETRWQDKFRGGFAFPFTKLSHNSIEYSQERLKGLDLSHQRVTNWSRRDVLARSDSTAARGRYRLEALDLAVTTTAASDTSFEKSGSVAYDSRPRVPYLEGNGLQLKSSFSAVNVQEPECFSQNDSGSSNKLTETFLPRDTDTTSHLATGDDESMYSASDKKFEMGSVNKKQDFDDLLRKWTEAKVDLRNGKQRADEFARDSGRNFVELVSTWRDPRRATHDATLDSKKRAEEWARSSTANFCNLISTWKARPSHLECCLSECQIVDRKSSSQQGLVGTNVETNIDDHDQSPSSVCRTSLRLTQPVEENLSEKGDELMAYWRANILASNKYSDCSSAKAFESELNHAGNTGTGFEAQDKRNIAAIQAIDVSSLRVRERSVAWEENVVTDIKLFFDDVSVEDENIPYDFSEKRGLDAHDYFKGLILKHQQTNDNGRSSTYKKAETDSFTSRTSNDLGDKPVEPCDPSFASQIHGEKSDASHDSGERSDFNELRTNWSHFEASNSKGGLSAVTPNESAGKQRAAGFAHDVTVDIDGLRTPWCKSKPSSGDDVPHEELIESAGKLRAQEFAKNASVTIRDLMERWNDKNYSSLEFLSPDAQRESRSVPTLAPIRDFIAALSAGHKPMVGSVSSEEEREETESLFDDVEVATDHVPEGEDPIVAPNGHLITCACASSIFSGNDKLVDFFLPKLGMACSCGKDAAVIPDPNVADPTSIDMILRPWQCEFLQSFGIIRGDQLVKAYHRSAGILAKAMKKWRKKNNLVRARTVSCGLALHIWSTVCKIYVRSIRHQIASGVEVVKPPTTMNVLSQVLSQSDRRVSIPHSGRKRIPVSESYDPDSAVEI